MEFARLENIDLNDLYTYNLKNSDSSDEIQSPLTSTSSADLTNKNQTENNTQHVGQVEPDGQVESDGQVEPAKEIVPPEKSFSPELKGKIESNYHTQIETYAEKVKKTLQSLTSNKWLSIALALIIVLTVCILFLFLPKTPVFHKPNQEIETLFKERGEEIKQEILEKVKTKDTQVIPLFTENTLFTENFPKTYEILQEVPLKITYAGIVSIKPDFFQIKHYGYAPNANKTYRYFYVLRDSSVGCSGIWIDGEKKMFSAGGLICADVSRESCLFNDCVRRNAIAIFFDVLDESRRHGISVLDDIQKDDLLRHFT